MNAFTEHPSIAGIEILPIRLNGYFDFHSPDDIRLKGTRQQLRAERATARQETSA
jgi:hypothetical protein